MEEDLLYALHIREAKVCFFCGVNRKVGLKYINLADVLGLYTHMMHTNSLQFLEENPRKFLAACVSLDNDLICIEQLLRNDMCNTEDINQLFSHDIGGICKKKHGVPICWKDCHYANELQTYCTSLTTTQEKRILENIIIDDIPFDLGYITYDTNRYNEFLAIKINNLQHILQTHHIFPSIEESIPIEINTSPIKFFRMRCRFSIRLSLINSSMEYLMWEEQSSMPKYIVTTFPIASTHINIIMPLLKTHIESCEILRNSLNSVNFLSSLTGNVIITLIYENRQLDEIWDNSAKQVRLDLQQKCSEEITSIQFIGRGSHHSKRIIDVDYIHETFVLHDERVLQYIQVIDGFSNPNAIVNMKSLNYICSIVQNIPGLTNTADNTHNSVGSYDLLEMYCGMGNHTIALSKYCRRIVAVELNKHLCIAANKNLELNNIKNVRVITGDSYEFATKILARKKYTSKEGDIYTFEIVLVDPPRCGLDSTTRHMIAAYNHIIYISCNPEALARDLTELTLTHRIVRIAVFDHFPYTPHLESGVYLVKL